MIDVKLDPAVVDLAVALVEATDVSIEVSSHDLRAYCDEVAERVIREELPGGEPRRGAVRQLLRHGGFKPAGRSKPAQEYLLRTVRQESGLPRIWNVVDLINAVSLDSGFPISLVSIGRAGVKLVIRYGDAGERFVFNRAGQELNLGGLITICSRENAGSVPRGSPVKDSLEAKVTDEDRHVLACIFAPASDVDSTELRTWGTTVGEGFVRWCGASQFQSWLVPEP